MMVDWNAILAVGIYPLAFLAPVLDGLSTFLLLKYDDQASEVNSRVVSFHDRFGLVKGQAAFTTAATVLWVGAIHLVRVSSGLALTSLAVGMYLGFSLKQFYNGYCIYRLP